MQCAPGKRIAFEQHSFPTVLLLENTDVLLKSFCFIVLKFTTSLVNEIVLCPKNQCICSFGHSLHSKTYEQNNEGSRIESLLKMTLKWHWALSEGGRIEMAVCLFCPRGQSSTVQLDYKPFSTMQYQELLSTIHTLSSSTMYLSGTTKHFALSRCRVIFHPNA